MTIEFHKLVDIKPKSPTVVVGFPGTGLVGSIAAAYLVDSLGFEFIGYVTSPDFAPLASIHNYKAYPPMRIHYSKKYDILVVLSEMSVPISSSSMLASEIFTFAKSMNASSIISLGGISLKESPNAIYVLSSDETITKKILDSKKFKSIKEGATTGVSGVLLTEGTIHKFPVTLFLSEASEDYVDPGAASSVLKALSSYLNLPVDTKKLDKEAKDVGEQMRESVVKSKAFAKKSKDLGPMYG